MQSGAAPPPTRRPVSRVISNRYLALGPMNGLAIVFDRISQGFGKNLQKHRRAQRPQAAAAGRVGGVVSLLLGRHTKRQTAVPAARRSFSDPGPVRTAVQKPYWTPIWARVASPLFGSDGPAV